MALIDAVLIRMVRSWRGYKAGQVVSVTGGLARTLELDRYAVREPQPQFEKARTLLEAADKVRAGVTLVNGILVARLLGEATQVRAAVTRFLGDFRGQRLPRVWHI